MVRALLLLGLLASSACVTRPRTVRDVPFTMGTPGFPTGDSVEITGIAGTRSRLEVGGVYVVSGRVHLVSRDDARVALYSTGEGNQVRTEGFRSVVVPKGESTFDFAIAILADGDLNLTLSPTEDTWSNDAFGEVYFRDPDRPFLYGGIPRVSDAE
jgi:hypothetical protein